MRARSRGRGRGVFRRLAGGRAALVLVIAAVVANGCASSPPPAPPRPPAPAATPEARTLLPPPTIEAMARPLSCVPYARARTAINIRGNAWTWWTRAEGRYRRGHMPAPGAVLVLKRKGNSRGHLAVVTHILGPRVIVVDHANWLNRGRIHRNSRVRDVSPANDWSEVRVWHTPSGAYGASVYPAYGFIYADRTVAELSFGRGAE